MLKKDQINMLKKSYAMTDTELRQLGLLNDPKQSITARVTESEYKEFTKLAYDLNVKKATLFNDFLNKKAFQNHFKITKSKRLKLKKPDGMLYEKVSFKVPMDVADRIKQLSNSNYMSISCYVRCCIQEIIERKGVIK